MTETQPEVDLDVSGPTATAIAGSILSICEEASDPDSVSVTLSLGSGTVTVAGDGHEAVEMVPRMVSSVDWGETSLDAISVQMSESHDADDEQFTPPEAPEPGDRLTEWQRSDSGITPVGTETNRYETLAFVASNEPTTAGDLVEELGYERSYASSVLSGLYGKCGLLDRAKVYNGHGGKNFMYRVNDHGRAVLND